MIGLGIIAASKRRAAPGGGGVVITSDSFDRADSALGGSTTDCALGGSPMVWYNKADHEVAGGLLRSTSSRRRYSNVDAQALDIQVSVRVQVLGSFRLTARGYDNDSRTRCVYVNVGGDGSLTLEWIQDGGSTTIATAPPGTVAAGSTLALRCSGPDVSALIDSSVVAQGTYDPTGLLAGGNVGVLTTSKTVRLDDFKAEEA